jgi:hypothetical protein
MWLPSFSFQTQPLDSTPTVCAKQGTAVKARASRGELLAILTVLKTTGKSFCLVVVWVGVGVGVGVLWFLSSLWDPVFSSPFGLLESLLWEHIHIWENSLNLYHYSLYNEWNNHYTDHSPTRVCFALSVTFRLENIFHIEWVPFVIHSTKWHSFCWRRADEERHLFSQFPFSFFFIFLSFDVFLFWFCSLLREITGIFPRIVKKRLRYCSFVGQCQTHLHCADPHHSLHRFPTRHIPIENKAKH